MMKSATKELKDLEQIPGVGPSLAQDLADLGIENVAALRGRDPQKLYDRLCQITGEHQDRCVLYVFRCAVYFASESRPDPELLKWWNWKDANPKVDGSARFALSRKASGKKPKTPSKKDTSSMFKRIVPVLAIVGLAAANAMAADSPFVGDWKLDLEKSKMTGLQEKIEDLGGGEFKFDFGDDIETIKLDGKDHLTKYGSMWSVTPEGTDKWKSVHKRDGKVTSTATWTVSDEGKSFTSETDGTRPDGTTYHNTFKAKRIAGEGKGLAATWESTEMKLGSPEDWEIKPFESDGLSFVTPALKEVDDVKFDGKDYANKGPRVAPESTTSGKQIDERTLELYQKLKGKLMVTQDLEVSEDGKVLTDVLHFPGMKQTETDVYEKK